MAESDRKPLDVVVLTPLGEGGKGGIDRIMDYVRGETARLADPDLRLHFLTTRGAGPIWKAPLYTWRAMRDLRRLKAAGQADIVHVNLSQNASVARKYQLVRLCVKLGLPYVVHLHGSRFRQYWSGAKPALRGRIDYIFTHATAAYLLGNVWRDFVADRLGDKAPVLKIVPNATPRFEGEKTSGGDVPMILFLGAIGERKGTYDLIEALTQIPEGLPWRAVIGGNGAVEEAQSRAAAAGLGDRAAFPGWVGPAEVEAYLRQADILTLPSYDENLPMSVIEGMAAGLPVVTTPVGATEDIITDDVTGLLVQPGDVAALSAAFARLLAEPETRARLGTAARAFHEDHLEIQGYVARLIGHWREDAARPAASRRNAA